MNQTINDGVHAVRAAGQRVLDRVESAAEEVATEARDAGERLSARSGKKSGKRLSMGFGKRDRKRAHRPSGKAAGLVASATSVVAFLVTLVVRRKRKREL